MMGLQEIVKANENPTAFYRRNITDGQCRNTNTSSETGLPTRQDNPAIDAVKRLGGSS